MASWIGTALVTGWLMASWIGTALVRLVDGQ